MIKGSLISFWGGGWGGGGGGEAGGGEINSKLKTTCNL